MVEKHRHVNLADEIANLPSEEGAARLENETTDTIVEVIRETRPRKAAELLHQSGIDLALEVIRRLPPDDAVDVLGELRHRFRIRVLNRLDFDQHQDLLDLLQYPPDTAGGVMTTSFISFPPNTTVGDAINHLRESYDTVETVYYAYVLEDGKLVGTVSLKELTLADPDMKLEDIMQTELETLDSSLDREEVVNIFDRHQYQAMPVVEDGEMKGIITFDDVIDVMRKEATEDVQKIAGSSGNEEVFSKWSHKVRKRAPWLYINVFAAFLAAGVVSHFEGTIAQITVLAAFIPIINNQAGNTGMQALSVTIRGQATGQMSRSNFRIALGKEIAVGIANGLLIGSFIGLIAFIWQADVMLGGVIFLSMLLTILVSTLAGFIVPTVLERVGYDPATASTIFVTAIADISGILFMLGFATLYLL